MSTPVDHQILDAIIMTVPFLDEAHRESECIEFYDAEQEQWFEIVVRPIDDPSN